MNSKARKKLLLIVIGVHLFGLLAIYTVAKWPKNKPKKVVRVMAVSLKKLSVAKPKPAKVSPTPQKAKVEKKKETPKPKKVVKKKPKAKKLVRKKPKPKKVIKKKPKPKKTVRKKPKPKKVVKKKLKQKRTVRKTPKTKKVVRKKAPVKQKRTVNKTPSQKATANKAKKTRRQATTQQINRLKTTYLNRVGDQITSLWEQPSLLEVSSGTSLIIRLTLNRHGKILSYKLIPNGKDSMKLKSSALQLMQDLTDLESFPKHLQVSQITQDFALTVE